MSEQGITDKRLDEIRDWFERHQDDYDAKSLHGPPRVWSEYFRDLLRAVQLLRGR